VDHILAMSVACLTEKKVIWINNLVPNEAAQAGSNQVGIVKNVPGITSGRLPFLMIGTASMKTIRKALAKLPNKLIDSAVLVLISHLVSVKCQQSKLLYKGIQDGDTSM